MSGKKISHIPQIDASLDKPLDVDAPPTIYGTSLTPELATASLNLSVDFLKQQQGIANTYLLTHPFTLFTISLFLVIYWALTFVYPKEIQAASVTGYLYQFSVVNKKHIGSGLLFTLIITSFIFTLLSRITDSYFKTKIDEITKSKGETLFGVNLNDLITPGNKEVIKSPQLKNTHIVVYRNTPISLVTISPNNALSSDESLVVAMSSIGCRRVYIKSGILEDLLDWAMLRTKAIGKEQKAGESMKILYVTYSFDLEMKKILKSKGFKMIQAVKVRDNRLLGGLFGVNTELWGAQFRVESTNKK